MEGGRKIEMSRARFSKKVKFEISFNNFQWKGEFMNFIGKIILQNIVNFRNDDI